MSNLAIQLDGLGKMYHIGSNLAYRTLRDSVAGAMRAAVGRRPRGGAGWRGGGRPSIWALRDLAFTVKRGEVVGVVGRNGAGKSTLLKILSRVTQPTVGRGEVHGRVASLLEVGTGFHPELTGRENCFLNGALLGMKRAEIARKLDEIVAFAEVEPFIDTPVKYYSSGMYMRLAFAVAAHLEAEILLVDEVLAVGDAAFQEKCIGRMANASRCGRTVLFVSHNMDAVLNLCDRVMWLREGSLVVDGCSSEVVSEYLKDARGTTRQSDGRVWLLDHPGRQKTFDGMVRLTYCRVAGEGSARVTAGGECRVVLGYETAYPLSGKRVNFVIAFRGETGPRLASCWSQLVSGGLDELPRVGEVECQIRRLPLVPGSYLLDVGVQVAGGWSDVVYQAATAEVEPGEYYSCRGLPSGEWGRCLLEYVWTTPGG